MGGGEGHSKLPLQMSFSKITSLFRSSPFSSISSLFISPALGNIRNSEHSEGCVGGKNL